MLRRARPSHAEKRAVCQRADKSTVEPLPRGSLVKSEGHVVVVSTLRRLREVIHSLTKG